MTSKTPAKRPPMELTDPQTKVQSLVRNIESGQLYPDGATPKDVAADLVIAMTNNIKLRDCTTESIYNALRILKRLNSRISTGPLADVWLIPYRDNDLGVMNATVNVGSGALLRIAKRTGQILNWESFAVFEGDEFKPAPGLYGVPHHVYGPDSPHGDDSKITHVYSVFEVPPGNVFRSWILSRQEIEEKFRAHSKAANDTAWSMHWREMAFRRVEAYPFKRGWLRFCDDTTGITVAESEDDREDSPILDHTPARPTPEAERVMSEIRPTAKDIANAKDPGELFDKGGEAYR